jgi:nucleoside-diphosphate-sugar epimerase
VNDLYLVTGGAGFIGSHLVERLLLDGGRVRVLDNYSTGSSANLPFATEYRDRLELVEGDVRDLDTVERAAQGTAVIFHQAALRSVPQSVADPLGTNDQNVTGTLHIFEAARRAGTTRVVYASSSAVYGANPELPKREAQPLDPISPYGASKAATELYAAVWTRLYGVETVGLRYFNVFGPRQDPKSEYAAVIPRFILWGLEGTPLEVHGDGLQSRDFTYVDNVVEANIVASRTPHVGGEVFNIGCGEQITLLDIIARLERVLGHPVPRRHSDALAGDIRHSLADVAKADRLLGRTALVSFEEGFRRTVEYFKTSASTTFSCRSAVL